MDNRERLVKEGFLIGIRRGWAGFLWMMKIIVPISLLTAVLAWSGLIERSNVAIQPLLSWLRLPAVAALPLLIGMLTGIYGGIASMAMLPLTKEQMTLVAIFLLIAHNLIQEGVIQGKSGLHPLKATVCRLLAAAVTVMVCGRLLQISPEVTAEGVTGLAQGSQTFAQMLLAWLHTTLILSAKIFAIIMSLLTLLEIFKVLGWIDRIVRALRPLLRGFGLSDKAGVLWMTAVIFGLAYGAAVIVEEAREGYLSREELEVLHLSIGINHSLIEDPALFLSFGLSALWLWVPRIITAVIAVRIFTLWQRSMKTRLFGKP
jgi:spore maturation protein SpmB